MSIAKGGRAKKAPYSSEMYRIPSPIKPAVMQLAELYRQGLWDGSLESLQIGQDQDLHSLSKRIKDAISAYEGNFKDTDAWTEAKAFIEDLQNILSAKPPTDASNSGRNLVEK